MTKWQLYHLQRPHSSPNLTLKLTLKSCEKRFQQSTLACSGSTPSRFGHEFDEQIKRTFITFLQALSIINSGCRSLCREKGCVCVCLSLQRRSLANKQGEIKVQNQHRGKFQSTTGRAPTLRNLSTVVGVFAYNRFSNIAVWLLRPAVCVFSIYFFVSYSSKLPFPTAIYLTSSLHHAGHPAGQPKMERRVNTFVKWRSAQNVLPGGNCIGFVFFFLSFFELVSPCSLQGSRWPPLLTWWKSEFGFFFPLLSNKRCQRRGGRIFI